MVSSVTPEHRMYDVIRTKEEINLVAVELIGRENVVFSKDSLPIPKFKPSELGFIRTVSWLYVLYREVGRIGVEFLQVRFSAYELDPDGTLSSHVKVVNDLRTLLLHSLNPSRPRDTKLRQHCNEKYQAWCGTPVSRY